MIKCTLLLPNTDNEGNCLLASHTRILNLLYEQYGGYTVNSNRVYGSYCMADSSRIDDISTSITVVVQPGQVKELKEWVAQFACELRQETLYFETSSDVEFIKSSTSAKLSAAACKCKMKSAKQTKQVQPRGETLTLGEILGLGVSPSIWPSIPNVSLSKRHPLELEDLYGVSSGCKASALQRAESLEKEVNTFGGAEVGGELSCKVVKFLRDWGYPVHIYTHHGVTATVVRPRD